MRAILLRENFVTAKLRSMKTVIFVRHAKSSWSDFNLSDHDRPLDERGLRDAPRMAARLYEKGVLLDHLLSSTAKRARSTAQYFASAQGLNESDIETEKELYHAYPDTIIDQVQMLDDRFNCVALFGHNPGYTELYNLFTSDLIDNLPTCGVFKVEADIDTWIDFRPDNARITDYFFPKQG
jgi:phosphohistidine phosphatase